MNLTGKKKFTKEELATMLAQMTREYTVQYFQNFKTKMDKQNWAALHIGFTSALQHCAGYSLKELSGVLELTRTELMKDDAK